MAAVMVRSGLASTYRVTYLDGATDTVTTIPGDAMAWERLHKMPFQNNIGASSTMWVIWRALRREQRCQEANAEHWADGVADFEIESDEDDDQDAEDPTRPAP